MTRGETQARLSSPGGWGEYGNDRMTRYMKPIKSRWSCAWGCGNRTTHVGMANGVALTDGCELHVARWVKEDRDG